MRLARRFLRRALIVALVAVALVNGIAAVLTPVLDLYRDELAAYASEKLDIPLSLGGLHARWRGYGPEIVLKDLRIGALDQPGSVHLADAAIDFGLWDMLRHRDISPLRITLRHLEIHLIRDQQGELRLAGFEALQNGPLAGRDTTTEGELSALPLSGRLRLEDVTILWEDQRLGLPLRRLENAQLRMHLWPDKLVLAASIQLPGKQPGSIHAAAEVALAGEDWSGEAYLQARLPEAAAQLGPYLPEGLRVTRGGIELEAWSDWQASRLSTLEGHLQVKDLSLDRGPDSPALDLQRASTDFRYRREGEVRHINLAKLSVSRAGHHWPPSQLYMKLDLSREGLPELQLAAGRLRLGDLLAMTRPVPLPEELVALREGLQADAVLRDLRFRLEPGSGPPRWQISAEYEEMTSQAWRDYPGVAGLGGTLQGNQDALAVQVDASHTQLDLPTLFRAPLPVRRLHGLLELQHDEHGWALHTDDLLLNTPDIDTRSRISLSQMGDAPLEIDLQTNFGNGESSFAERYYPAHIMEPDLVAWLDRSIGRGLVPRGTLLVRGPAADFPYDRTHNGHFEVRFDVTDVQLDYLPEWPTLTIGEAEVRFHNNSLAIHMQRGRIYDSDVLPTEAHIRSLDPVSPLEIKGVVEGPLADPIRLLAESPLKEDFGELAGSLQASGQSRLALDFAAVLDKVGEDRLAGSLELQHSGLTLPDWQLALTQANGTIDFDLNGVRAKGIRATSLGQPVQIDVSPLADGALVKARTRVDVPTLTRRFPALARQLPAKLVSGETELAVEVDVPRTPGPQRRQTLKLTSDLTGIAIHLPAPLGKSPDQARPIELTMPLNGNGQAVELSYDSLLTAAFLPGGDRLAIHLGPGQAQLPEQDVFKVSGHLDELILDPWLALDSGEGGLALPPLRAEISLDRLQVRQFEQHDVRLKLQLLNNGWQGQLESRELAGSFDIPSAWGSRPIGISLDRLQLTLDPDAQEGPKQDTGAPADWPELDLNVAKLQVNQVDFGQLTLKARQTQDGLQLDPIRLESPAISFSALGLWSNSDRRTSLTGKLKANELGRVLQGLGYSQQFSGAETSADFDLSWPGNPASFKLADLTGTLDLVIHDGQLLEVDPGVGRMVGLLNFRALRRRLRLDFSDLFDKGLAFDAITGTFRFSDGNARTTNLKMRGPTGDIYIKGRVGLVQQDLYQEITVEPRMDATLPVAGALAAGPWAGVAVLLAQTLMKDKVKNINRVRYQVAGSWDDPKIEQLRNGQDFSTPLPFDK